jgi:5,5'-dehydrodivanillate O-demethylase
LNQDFIAWWSQGALTDRSKEKLGRTDTPVIFLRRQLAEQIKIVEEGGDPMNVFRDAEAMPEILFGGGNPSQEWVAPDWVSRARFSSNNNRLNYHKGGAQRESDRYGSAVPLVAELHRRIEDAQKRGVAIG